MKKVSKYENKFAKLQKKAAEFNFRNQLKTVKKKEFTMDEEEAAAVSGRIKIIKKLAQNVIIFIFNGHFRVLYTLVDVDSFMFYLYSIYSVYRKQNFFFLISTQI